MLARKMSSSHSAIAAKLGWTVAGGVLTTALALAPARAQASPAVDGVRNLSLGSVSRSSSFGTSAALINPSAMSMTQQFAIEPTYQLEVQSKTHGLGFVVMDSLNNARVALALGYLFMRGLPSIHFADTDTMETRDFELSRFGHEAWAAVSIVVVKQWLSLGLKPKYQYTSLRYRDTEGVARNAHKRLNAFGLDISATSNLAGWAALSVVATNVVGNHPPAYTDDREIRLTGLPVQEGSFTRGELSELSDYPLTVAHGLSVFPLHRLDFSINFDGTYDFTTYAHEDHVRLTYGGSAEFVAGPVPLRFGSYWDSRGKGDDDDRVFVAGGVAYVKPAKVGGVGVDVGFGFRQQVAGPQKDTVLGFNLGLRLHPDL